MRYNWKYLLLGAFGAATLLQSCGDPENPEPDGPSGVHVPPNVINPPATFGVNGQIFSIPSPVQTAILIKESGADFDESMLNPRENADMYSTMFQKAVNLGVYGADLGYATIYEDDVISLDYLSSVRILAQAVGVENAFDEDLITRFMDNKGNQDSMLVFISEAYQAADNYLKENDKGEQAGMVLAGGWIEAMHFSCNVALQGNEAVKTRIADQKATLHSLIELLHTLEADDDDFIEFVSGMEMLHQTFDAVTSAYKYVEPQTYAEKKLTVFKSTNEVTMEDAVLDEIATQIADLRELITQ